MGDLIYLGAYNFKLRNCHLLQLFPMQHLKERVQKIVQDTSDLRLIIEQVRE